MAITKAYQGQNMTGYVETFKSLHVDVDLLADEYTYLYIIILMNIKQCHIKEMKGH